MRGGELLRRGAVEDVLLWAKEQAARSKTPMSFIQADSAYSPRLTQSLERLDHLVNWEHHRRASRDQKYMRVTNQPCVELLDALGNPQRGFRSVHVTGSKGKGSVVATIAAALRRHGITVGCFCSPHVQRVNERVLVNLREVDDDVLADAIERVLAVRHRAGESSEARRSTWFDVLTAAGMTVLGESGVRWCAVEVGLGGAIDSTNVLDAEVCVITNIMLEHAAIIGPERRDIAREKAGIIRRRDAAVVTAVDEGDADVVREIVRAAEQAHAQPVRFVRHGREPANISAINNKLAGAVLDELGQRNVVSELSGRPLSHEMLDEHVKRSAALLLKGRMERFSLSGVHWIVDGAHVPESVALALDEVTEQMNGRTPVIVLGLGADKDAKRIAEAIESRLGANGRVIITATGADQRYMTPLDVRAAFSQKATQRQVSVIAKSSDAFAGAQRQAQQLGDSFVFVVGSLHLAGAARNFVQAAAAEEGASDDESR